MNNNQRANRIAIQKYRKELESLCDDIKEIDIKCLNKAVNIGLGVAKQNTPSDSGFMRKSWKSTPAVKSKSRGVTKTLVNTAHYSPYVNYGHRVVRNGNTVGWVPGQFMLEKAISYVDKALLAEFKKEVERVRREHDK